MSISHIEWTDATWNPTTGCDRVSPGCDHCYALTMAKRLKGMGNSKYQTDGDPRTSGPGFGLTVHPDVLDVPLSWAKPRRVFVNSMSDLFHDDVPDGFIWSVFVTMARTPRHTYQVLTKRHGRMRSLLNRWANDGWEARDHRMVWNDLSRSVVLGALPNVWLGVSVEEQKWADIRIPALLGTPAAVRFLSLEPLLGPVDLHAHDDGHHHWLPDFGEQYDDGSGLPVCQDHGISECRQGCAFIDWAIIGGESGPLSRPMEPAWALDLADQCAKSGVPAFVKQLGSVWARSTYVGGQSLAKVDPKGGDPRYWPEGLAVREYPAVAA